MYKNHQLSCTLKYLIYKAKISQQSFCVQTFEHKIFRRIRTFVMDDLAVTVQSLPLSGFFLLNFRITNSTLYHVTFS